MRAVEFKSGAEWEQFERGQSGHWTVLDTFVFKQDERWQVFSLIDKGGIVVAMIDHEEMSEAEARQRMNGAEIRRGL